MSNTIGPNLTIKASNFYASDPGLVHGDGVVMTNDFYETHKDEDGWVTFSTDSQGENTLTAEQKEELSQNYDVTDMTENQQLQLLGNLTVLGVVSSADFDKAFGESVSQLALKTLPQTSGSDITSVSNVKTYETGKDYNWVKEHLNSAQSETENGEYASDGKYDSRIGEILEQLG
jgi:hypothetical protein